MRRIFLSSLFSLAMLLSPTVNATPLVSALGETAVIPSWQVQSSAKVGDNVTELSALDLDVSGWYSIGSRGTLMATLLENNVYRDSDLFFSNSLEKVDHKQFQVPWFYRAEFEVTARTGSLKHDYFQLKTHGISSRADIYLNGVLVADKSVQAGAYAGLTYDTSNKTITTGKNLLLIKVYPTDYNRDFALGFVDWNPYPPDNGTGIWRDVQIKQTGPLSFVGPPRATTRFSERNGNTGVSVRVDVRSISSPLLTRATVVCSVYNPEGHRLMLLERDVKLATTTQKVSLDFVIANPEIWWPKQWGTQPLYSTSCELHDRSGPVSYLSDSGPKVRFGVRTVMSSLNKFNDTTFSINGKPFQVLGAGYTSDIFLRFNESKVRTQFQYVLDMGLNTVRLEGKQEHPRFYEIADEMGIVIMAGWECCDKWEGWSYNDEGFGEKWNNGDYAIANVSMRHEAELLQHHPSILAFLVGSDFWPDDRAVQIYVDALKAFDWDVPIIASASQRGYPTILGNGGMKMDGPYDWVPPNYWYDQLGAAFGFGSELGAGVGTPELNSLKRFLSPSDLDDIWQNPNKGLYHMSTNVSSFYTREIYNTALWKRYGAPTSLDNYLLKAQMMDYEATRAEFEAYATRWTAERPATGLIYWMLNNAWPSLHWNLFDYYLHPAGSYFGTKVGSRLEHVAYDYITRSVYLINRSLSSSGSRTVDVELIDINGTTISKAFTTTQLSPNNSTELFEVERIDKIRDVALLRLVLRNGTKVLSRNVYHITPQSDVLDFDNSTWYHTPVTKYADFTALNNLSQADLVSNVIMPEGHADLRGDVRAKVKLHNRSNVPAVFVRLNLVYENSNENVIPVVWNDNYVTLWPGEMLDLEFGFHAGSGAVDVEIDGWNVKKWKQRIGKPKR